MNKKEAYEHLLFVKKAIRELGYDCMSEFNDIRTKYKANKYHTNYELYNATSIMMCNARHRAFA